MKFIRRNDVTLQDRIDMALSAIINQGIYGAMTQLSLTYKVSRTFVYQIFWAASLALTLQFSLPTRPKQSLRVDQQWIDRCILSWRLEGKCSIESISNMLTTLGVHPGSVGYVSQRLSSYAQKLPSTLQAESATFVMFLSDEVFACHQPILVTIEPKSMAILNIQLADDRTAQTWKAHWQAIEHNQFYTLGLASDRGKGLTEGFKQAFPDQNYYPDQFHDLRDLAKTIGVDLEKAAYQAIAFEYKCQQLWLKARSQSSVHTRYQAYQTALLLSQKAMELYENYSYLLNQLRLYLDLFDSNGHIRKPHGDIQAILDLMEELAHPRIQSLVDILKQRVDSMLLYFQKAQLVYDNLQSAIHPQKALQALCLAWQSNHKLYQAKTSSKRRFFQQESDFYLDFAEAFLGQDFHNLKSLVFTSLDGVVRASSLVETVNSLIRPYLNTCKGHITQDTLNLIMFYHNHRKFRAGKRKHRAPIEILMAKPLEKHWLDLLMAV